MSWARSASGVGQRRTGQPRERVGAVGVDGVPGGLQVGSEGVLAVGAGGACGGHLRAQIGLGAAGGRVDVAVVGEIGAGGEGQVHALAWSARPARVPGAAVLARQRAARR
ncbi:hypothetical protein, partial [Kitasatospora sp. NPDC001527]|uniref:hypothetical protein n=1 Tax=Kitasatospora sp. NPDC001527 TaxID=3154519 RepID=UPI0033291A86